MKNTGNSKVDAIASLHIEGDITPRSWYQHIYYKTKNNEVKVDRLAIDILSDILYWYRPFEKRDEITGHSLGWHKKFSEEMLRRSPDDFAKCLNATPRCIRESMKVLEGLGLITITYKPLTTAFGVIPNCMYIDVNPIAIERITYSTHNNTNSPSINAETLDKSLSTKWVTTDYEMRNEELRNASSDNTKCVTTNYEMRNLSIYKNSIENSIQNSTESNTPLTPQGEERAINSVQAPVAANISETQAPPTSSNQQANTTSPSNSQNPNQGKKEGTGVVRQNGTNEIDVCEWMLRQFEKLGLDDGDKMPGLLLTAKRDAGFKLPWEVAVNRSNRLYSKYDSAFVDHLARIWAEREKIADWRSKISSVVGYLSNTEVRRFSQIMSDYAVFEEATQKAIEHEELLKANGMYKAPTNTQPPQPTSSSSTTPVPQVKKVNLPHHRK